MRRPTQQHRYTSCHQSLLIGTNHILKLLRIPQGYNSPRVHPPCVRINHRYGAWHAGELSTQLLQDGAEERQPNQQGGKASSRVEREHTSVVRPCHTLHLCMQPWHSLEHRSAHIQTLAWFNQAQGSKPHRHATKAATAVEVAPACTTCWHVHGSSRLWQCMCAWLMGHHRIPRAYVLNCTAHATTTHVYIWQQRAEEEWWLALVGLATTSLPHIAARCAPRGVCMRDKGGHQRGCCPAFTGVVDRLACTSPMIVVRRKQAQGLICTRCRKSTLRLCSQILQNTKHGTWWAAVAVLHIPPAKHRSALQSTSI